MPHLERWKKTEPVRFYLWSTGLALIVVVTTIAVVTGQWAAAGSTAAGLLGLIGCGGEAARASVYSPAGVMAERVDAERRGRLQRYLW